MRARLLVKYLSLLFAFFFITSINIGSLEILVEALVHQNQHEVLAHHLHHQGHEEKHQHGNEEESHSHGYECCKLYIASNISVSQVLEELQSTEVMARMPIPAAPDIYLSSYRISPASDPPDTHFKQLISSFSHIPNAPPLI